MGVIGSDSNIKLFLNLRKQFYIAGEYVDGSVYLDATIDRPYTALYISLKGEEYAFWKNDKNQESFYSRSKFKSYDDQFLLADFGGEVKRGSYQFPFRFLLPSSMPGSFYLNENFYITYKLKTILAHSKTERENQQHKIFLNVLQPPRIPRGLGSAENATNSKRCSSCGCFKSCACKNYGKISTYLQCDKNFVLSGDKINVKLIIDNSLSSIKVDNVKVTFQQIIFGISSNAFTTKIKEKQVILYSHNDAAGIGDIQQYTFQALIPSDIIDATAIGKVVGRYFVLHLTTSYGCCTHTLEAQLHLILHPRNLRIKESKQILRPVVWSPVIFNTVIYEKMKPYIYTPLALMPFVNMQQRNIRTNQNFAIQMRDMETKFKDNSTKNFRPEVNPKYYLQQEKNYDKNKKNEGQMEENYFSKPVSSKNPIQEKQENYYSQNYYDSQLTQGRMMDIKQK